MSSPDQLLDELAEYSKAVRQKFRAASENTALIVAASLMIVQEFKRDQAGEISDDSDAQLDGEEIESHDA